MCTQCGVYRIDDSKEFTKTKRYKNLISETDVDVYGISNVHVNLANGENVVSISGRNSTLKNPQETFMFPCMCLVRQIVFSSSRRKIYILYIGST